MNYNICGMIRSCGDAHDAFILSETAGNKTNQILAEILGFRHVLEAVKLTDNYPAR